jgi:hypothetical protein
VDPTKGQTAAWHTDLTDSLLRLVPGGESDTAGIRGLRACIRRRALGPFVLGDGPEKTLTAEVYRFYNPDSTAEFPETDICRVVFDGTGKRLLYKDYSEGMSDEIQYGCEAVDLPEGRKALQVGEGWNPSTVSSSYCIQLYGYDNQNRFRELTQELNPAPSPTGGDEYSFIVRHRNGRSYYFVRLFGHSGYYNYETLSPILFDSTQADSMDVFFEEDDRVFVDEEGAAGGRALLFRGEVHLGDPEEEFAAGSVPIVLRRGYRDSRWTDSLTVLLNARSKVRFLGARDNRYLHVRIDGNDGYADASDSYRLGLPMTE